MLAALKDQADEEAEANVVEGGCPVADIKIDALREDVEARIEAKTGAREAEAGAVVARNIRREAASTKFDRVPFTEEM